MAVENILIIGAHWILRQGVKQTLRRLGLVIAGEGSSLEEAWTDGPGVTEPTIILVIAGQAGQFETALEAAHEAKSVFANVKLAILSETVLPEDVSASIRVGADALLSSTLSSRLLGNSLQLVLLGQKLFPTLPAQELSGEHAVANEAPPALPSPPDPAGHPPIPVSASRVIRLEDHVFPSRPPDSPANLVWSSIRPEIEGRTPVAVPSDREWEILRCLSSGKSNKAIARELGIAETTVKVHIKSLLRKLSVSNRTQAAIWALNHGDNPAPDAKPLLVPAQLQSK